MVRARAAVLLLAAATALGAAAQPPAPPRSLVDLGRDARAAERALDRAWGEAVNALVAAMADDPRAEDAWRRLQRAQALWSAYREASCAEAAPALLDARAARRATLECHIAATLARVAALDAQAEARAPTSP